MTTDLQTQRTAAQQLAQGSAAVDTSSQAGFTQSFQQVLADAKAAGNQMRAAAKSNPAIANAPRAYHRIVRVMTTDANTCSKS
jgi:hypothetical protein